MLIMSEEEKSIASLPDDFDVNSCDTDAEDLGSMPLSKEDHCMKKTRDTVDNVFYSQLCSFVTIQQPSSLTMEEKINIFYATAHYHHQFSDNRKKTLKTPGHPIKF